MSAPHNEINSFITRTRRLVIALGLFKGLLRALPFIAGTFLLAGALDQVFGLSAPVRQSLWVLFILGSLGLFISGLWPLKILSLQSRSRFLSEKSPALRSDELRLAQQFISQTGGQPGVTSDLRNLYIERVAAQLKETSAFWAFPPYPWKKRFVSGFIVFAVCGSLWAFVPSQFPLNPHIFFPFGSAEIEQFIGVLPGDASVDWGDTLEVRVSLLKPSLNKPSLFVKTGDAWSPLPLEREFESVQFYRLEHIVEPIQYRVFWKNEWGRKYLLTPRRPVEATKFTITIRPPSYTGETLLTQTEPEIKGLPGSSIEMKIELSEPVDDLKLVFADGQERSAEKESSSSFIVQFSIEKEQSYGFSIRLPSGEWRPLASQYPLHLASDQLPQINLLSPDQDLIIGDKERLPLTFEASDDFGIHQVILAWERMGREMSKVPVPLATTNDKSILSTFDWDLAREKLPPGAVLRYRLEVADGNSVTGPGRNATPWRTIEIQSFEKTHDAIEKALEQWREDAVKTLAQVNSLKSKVDKTVDPVDKLMADQAQAAQTSEDLEQLLKKIVDRMENDPLSDYGVWLEHKAMAENLNALNQQTMKEAQAAMQSNNKAAASEKLDQMSSELERMSALSEDLNRRQKAKDVVEKGNDLEKLAQDLMSQMKLDPKASQAINDILAQAEKILQEVAKALQSMPQDLPEDFVNQPALKQMDLQKPMDLLSQIQEALQAGDTAKAMELAQSLLKSAQSMQSQLSKAHEAYEESSSSEGLGKSISEEQKKLDQITQDQLKILAETQRLEGKRLQELLKAQEKIVTKLAERQSEAIKMAEALAADAKSADGIRLAAQSQISSMKNVGQELEAKKVDKSIQWLKDIVGYFRTVEAGIEKTNPTAQGKEKLASVIKIEDEILKELTKPVQPNDPFDAEDKKSFSDLQKKQSGLSQETQSLRKRVQVLSRKTASLGVKLSESLSKAGEAMSNASQSLGEKSSQAAFQSEEAALRELMESQSQMESASGSMGSGGQGGQGGGSGQGRSMRIISRGSSGQGSGAKTGQVRLPSADEYKAPKEFREELLKALKEKYPKIYEDVIYKYYKRLSE